MICYYPILIRRTKALITYIARRSPISTISVFPMKKLIMWLNPGQLRQYFLEGLLCVDVDTCYH